MSDEPCLLSCCRPVRVQILKSSHLYLVQVIRRVLVQPAVKGVLDAADAGRGPGAAQEDLRALLAKLLLAFQI